MLPMQGAQVRSLVRELRFHMPLGVAKKQKKTNEESTEVQWTEKEMGKKSEKL